SQAINIIDKQLRNSTIYLDWLKAQKWDGKLPLVTGSTGGGSGASGSASAGAIPFINIPLAETNNNANSSKISGNLTG
ncbi:MAG: hypothetical protein ACTHKC_04740, partial [Candidatus Nitrosocosmicus sp.]